MRLAVPVAAVVALAIAAAPMTAAAEPVTRQRMRFAERSGNLVVSASFTGLFDAAAYDELGSGVASVIVVRCYAYRQGEEMPVSFALANIRVAYDHWAEVYEVRIEGPLGVTRSRHQRRSDALRAITTLEQFPIAPLARVEIGPHHFLAMVVELNPISPELLAEVRRWLSERPGKSRLDAGSSFFGTFVSVFVNPKLAEADRVLRLRSQPFYRVKRSP